MYQTKTDTEMDGLAEDVLQFFKGKPPPLPPIHGKPFLTDSRKGYPFGLSHRKDEAPLQVR